MKTHLLRNVLCILGVSALVTLLVGGCAGSTDEEQDFFTSGSAQADQRAEQRMARARQISGEGKDSQTGEKKKPPLYERLGGDKGIQMIVDDFVARALNDPRVNWIRKDVKSGGFLGIRERSEYWEPNGQNVATLKQHLAQFLALATGGPAQYQGRDMKQVHQGMKITNAQFDAAVGDLKATLDKLQVPNDDQKELLAIIESTRPQVVEVR